MFVILCDPQDGSALWLHGALLDGGLEPLHLVSIEQLVYSTRIVHRLDGAGDTGEIQLSDGRVLRPEAIRGLVNRVRVLPTRHFDNVAPADRVYAIEELSAFLLAWLDAIDGRVVNPPLPFALGGCDLPLVTVMHCAAMAGLPTRRWQASSGADAEEAASLPAPTHAAIVFDGRLFGPILPRDLQEACRRLAVLLGLPLMQVGLNRSRDAGWRFVCASGDVDFRIGGKALAAGIARALASTPEPA